MFSNSKLTAEQRVERKEMLRQLPKGSTMANDGRTTFLCVPDGTVTRVFSSVMSEDEVKFRRKVGEFYALVRHFYDPSGGLILPGSDWTANVVRDAVTYA